MRIRIAPAGPDDVGIVQKIFEESPDYFRRTDRSEVLPHFASREMNESPPAERRSPTYKKEFCLAYLDGEAIGVVDLHRDHPVPGTTYIGLMLIHANYQGKGIGRSVYEAAETYARSKLNASKLALGISEENNVEAFWSRMGFSRNGKTYQWSGGGHVNQVFEMEKTIA